VNVELSWDLMSSIGRRHEHWGKYVRFAQFDKQGIGCSDRFVSEMTKRDAQVGNLVAAP
jgi:hypothetical protein